MTYLGMEIGVVDFATPLDSIWYGGKNECLVFSKLTKSFWFFGVCVDIHYHLTGCECREWLRKELRR